MLRLAWAGSRARIAIGVSGGLLVIALAGWLWWLPQLVRGRVQARLDRFGLVLDADGVGVGVGSVSLTDVRIGPKTEAAPWIAAEEVEVAWSPFRAFGSVSESIEKVRVEGARVKLDVDSKAFQEMVAARRQSSETKQNRPHASTPRRLPELEIAIAALEVRDAHGVLVASTGTRLSVAEERFEATSAEAQLGAAPFDVVAVKGASLQGALAAGRPVIARATVESATLDWTTDGDGSAPTASTFGRLLALRGLRASTEGAAGAASPKQGESAALWSDDARLELRRARVLSSEGGEKREMLSALTAVISAAGPTALRAKGQGTQADGGSLAWDVTAWPRDRRVEGNVKLTDVSLALFAPALPPLPFHELSSTRVTAELELVGQGLESIEFKGKTAISDLAFAAEGLAKTPVGPMSIEVGGEGTWTPARRELRVAHGTARVGSAEVALSGTLAWPADGYRVDLNALLARQPCRDVLASVPVGLLDELAQTELDGNFGAKLVVHVDAADLDATKVDFDIDDTCKFVSVPPLLDLLRFQQPFVHRALEPDGTTFEMETGPGTPTWTPIELVSPFMIQAVVAHEDGRFFGHRGFAEPEIGVALARNLKARAFRFGASTITMQLVKNVFLHREKLLSRKVQEAFITWWLEQNWDKRHILELYLNVIEYGPALYGIRNAAWHYFGTIPMNLTPAQAAFLASILPSPKTFHEQYDKRQLSPSMKNRLSFFLKHMHARQRIDDEALAFGLEELNAFSFYDPAKPPPVPPIIRGAAQPPPFNLADATIDRWDELEIPLSGPEEDGSFGAP